MTGVLYVVATPIGHLDDITRRAEDVLKRVTIVAAEDTRRARILLSHVGADPEQLVSLHEHNETRATERVGAALLDGAAVALISDAGTPLVSDPGFELVRFARGRDVPVVPVPGPSAVTAVLSVCDLAGGGFLFEGFLPARASARRARLHELRNVPVPVVFFEAPHRFQDTLADLSVIVGAQRPLFVGREMTKRFEEFVSGTVAGVVERFAEPGRVKGEFVCVLGAQREPSLAADVEHTMAALLEELPPSAAARVGARLTGESRGRLYELAQALRERAR